MRLLKLIETKKLKDEQDDEDDDDDQKEDKPLSKARAKPKSKKAPKPPVDKVMLVDPKKVTAQTEPQPKMKTLIMQLFDFKFAFGYFLPIQFVLLRSCLTQSVA